MWHTIKHTLLPSYSRYCCKTNPQTTGFCYPAANTPNVWPKTEKWQWKISLPFSPYSSSPGIWSLAWLNPTAFNSFLVLCQHDLACIPLAKSDFASKRTLLTHCLHRVMFLWMKVKQMRTTRNSSTVFRDFFFFKSGWGDGHKKGNASKMWEVLILAFWSTSYDLHISKWSSVATLLSPAWIFSSSSISTELDHIC